MRSTLLACTACVAGTVTAARAQPAAFTLVPFPADLPSESGHHAVACSADGSVFVIDASGTADGVVVSRVFRWTRSGGYSPLPGAPLSPTDTASAMSPDGVNVLGSTSISPLGSTSRVPCLWTGDAAPVLLPRRTATLQTFARALSADGAIIVGQDGPGNSRSPIIWSGAPLVVSALPLPSGFPCGVTNTISGDGALIGGNAYDPSSSDPASTVPCVWHNGTPAILPNPPGSAGGTVDFVSADASTIVGVVGFPGNSFKACVWASDSTVSLLQTRPGAAFSQVLGVSADGAVMVGVTSALPGGNIAALWKHGRFFDLRVLLQSRGAEVGNLKFVAGGVSADGKTVFGWTTSPTSQAYVATLPNPMCLSDFDDSGGTPDTTDIDAFFTAWLLGDPTSDADGSGGTPDGTDIDTFFIQWLAGGC